MSMPNLVVHVYEVGDDGWVEVGRILLRDGKVSCDPPTRGSLKAMIDDPIIIGKRFIYAKKDPVEFMKTLYRQYRGHLKASTAEPLEESDLVLRPDLQDVLGGTASVSDLVRGLLNKEERHERAT